MNRKYDHHPKQGAKKREDLTDVEVDQLMLEFQQKQDFLRSQCVELSPKEFYRAMFEEGFCEEEGVTEQERRPNGLISVLIDQDQPGRRYNRIIFDDLSQIDEIAGKEFAVVAPVAYSGRRRLAKLAYSIMGFAIDLDDVDEDCIKDLFCEMENGILPYASHIVNSGTGLHVYYIFENPLPAVPRYFEGLNRLKDALTDRIWNRYTSRSKNKQYQGIFQGYRVPGTQTKIREDCIVTAYRCGKKVTIHYLNDFVGVEHRSELDDINYVSLREAKELWEDWYQRRIIEKRPVGDYKLTEQQKVRRRAWYDSWIKKMRKGAFDGNRYYCIGVLFNYAMKAEIPLEEAINDAMELVDYLNSLTQRPKNQFTEDDVMAAIIYYDRKYIKMGRNGIMRMTTIDIGQTFRRGKKQYVHLKRARAVQNADDPDGEWRNKDGRPVKRDIVAEWRKANPDGKKAECLKETGLSKPTVYKWWDMSMNESLPARVIMPRADISIEDELLIDKYDACKLDIVILNEEDPMLIEKMRPYMPAQMGKLRVVPSADYNILKRLKKYASLIQAEIK